MIDFLFYSLQLSVCLVLLYLPYHFIFKKTTFYEWNRFYLLGAVLFALLAPLGDFQVRLSVSEDVQSLRTTFSESNIFTEKEGEFLDKSLSEQVSVTSPEQSISAKPNIKTDIANTDTNWLLVVYFAGIGLFALLYFLRLLKLFLLIKKGKQYQHQNFTEVQLSGESKQVFSFFGFIFLNRTQFTEYELATVLKHEQVHIRYWHSVDILLMEILQIVFWFNPLFRLYNKSLQNENEYFVDQLVAGKQSTSTYAETLLQLAVSKRPIVGQAFAYIPVKHRIFKLFQSPSPTMEKSKYLSVLPLLSLLFICFSCSLDMLDKEAFNDFTGKKVSMVKAYYTNQRATVKNKTMIGEIVFDENGIVEDIEVMHTFQMLDNGLPHYFPYFVNVKDIRSRKILKSVDDDFYLKNVQWLVVKDPELRNSDVLLYREELSKMVEFEREIYTNRTYDAESFVKENELVKFTKYERVNETSKETFSTTLNYNEHGKPVYLKREEIEVDNDGRFQVDSQMTGVQLSYNQAEQLSTLAVFSGKDSPDSSLYKIEFQYNELDQVKETALYNGEGMLVRKFQFAYNEAGYCTQETMIRKGTVAFTVDFEYDFYPAE
ncbi:M56 family metallopeptidase [Chondrinema litorale]|uniref:M56 family metallopeptidase n=1 Tax=Chondrinema litorale TaxID=2994555 RepID=UPI002542F1E6|nr:M56 family metallopeptidase [Chondrinema litorale]UZR95210.1 hypothetical protein OQ292_05180 [Chondrinema litorale]